MNSFESIVYDASYKRPEPEKLNTVEKVLPPKPVKTVKPMPKTTVFLALLITGLAINILTYVV